MLDERKESQRMIDFFMARARVLVRFHYFSNAVMSLIPVEKVGLGTFACDARWNLYYDPTLDWDLNETTGVIIHELQHLLREHHSRKIDPDPRRANIAADAEINDDLLEMKLSLPNPVTPASLNAPNNLTAEQYVQYIPNNKPFSCNDCGSGAHGQKREWETSGDGISPVEADLVRKNTARAVLAAGDAPVSLKRWAAEIVAPPRIQWWKILGRAVRRSVAGREIWPDYPGRRQLVPGVLEPRWLPASPRLGIIVDTSGSIGDDDIALAISTCKDAVKRTGAIQIWACDQESHRVQRMAPDALIGGGGTDMRVGMKSALEGRPQPSALVVITDCETPWPEHPLKVPVLVVTRNPEKAPSWAKVVKVE
jgi:predicted metal-dependent peptidase